MSYYKQDVLKILKDLNDKGKVKEYLWLSEYALMHDMNVDVLRTRYLHNYLINGEFVKENIYQLQKIDELGEAYSEFDHKKDTIEITAKGKQFLETGMIE